ncbi:hypothetical protein SOVF_196970 [Spinacia oleracea]|nr:hypothetical protein SOVF_196970 [Spinacia oleracea]
MDPSPNIKSGMWDSRTSVGCYWMLSFPLHMECACGDVV